MAKSPSHKWGQIIGDFLEGAFEKELKKFARKHKLFLDKKGERKARKGLKVCWIDSFGNAHDLDFVLERNGSENKMGEPVAFIESAWRRYTKHSRNKAQEIQGSVLPLAATHKNHAPFIGVVLAGEFTDGAVKQLDSLGFHVLYFPYNTIVKAFAKYGINAAYEENTPIMEFEEKIDKWVSFSDKEKLSKYLLHINSDNVSIFFEGLEKAMSRYIISVRILALHGEVYNTESIAYAVQYITDYNLKNSTAPVVKYELSILYNNGDKIDGAFAQKEGALNFLKLYSIPNPIK